MDKGKNRQTLTKSLILKFMTVALSQNESTDKHSLPPLDENLSDLEAENHEISDLSDIDGHSIDRSDDEESQASSKDYPDASRKQPWSEVLMLAFSSLGAIYGDLGTSPLYVLNSIKYPHDNPTKKDIYGAVSLIFYIFVIIVMIKYALIVLVLGPNNGEGGQVAIYAKVARYMKVGPQGVVIPGSPEKSDMELLSRQETTLSFMSSASLGSASKRNSFKNHPVVTKFVSHFILVGCFLGCSLVFSDGLLTPTTSVLSAIAGIQIAKPDFQYVLAVSEVVIIVLFLIQQFGSHKISFVFAPIIFLWLVGLVICGIYNIVRYQPGIFRALSPYYAIELLKGAGIDAFGGAILAITGAEAMFADLGHFGRLPTQIGISFVFVCLIICYMGQAAYVIVHPSALTNPFFYSIPGGLNSWSYWIMFVLATVSTIIASQALILGVFSIVSQLINLDCFPKLKITHVSAKYVGKVYVPLINLFLLIGVCATTAGFKNSNNVTAAYGLGITMDFVVTSFLLIICMVYVWDFHIAVPIIYGLIFIPLEIIMVVSNLKKVTHGAWFPLMMTVVMFLFLSFWRYGRSKIVEQQFESRIKIGDIYPSFKKAPPRAEVVDLGRGRAETKPENSDNEDDNDPIEFGATLPRNDLSTPRGLQVNSKWGRLNLSTYDGVAIVYSETPLQLAVNSPNTVPQVYGRLLSNFASIPSTFVFCSTRILSIPTVPVDERVLVGAMKIPGHYKCVLRFGYMEEVVIDKALNKAILHSIPDISRLIKKFQSSGNGLLVKEHIPVTHIFENNRVRSHDYMSEDDLTKNPFIFVRRYLRRFVINSMFSPLHSVFQFNDLFVKIADEAEEAEKKLFIGGVVRI